MKRVSTLWSGIRRFIFRGVPFLSGVVLCSLTSPAPSQSPPRRPMTLPEADQIRLAKAFSGSETLVPRAPSLFASLHEMSRSRETMPETDVPETSEPRKTSVTEWTTTCTDLLTDYLRNPETSTLTPLRRWCESRWENDDLTPDQRRLLDALRRRFPIWEGVVTGAPECRRLAELLERVEWSLPEQSEREFLETIAAMTRSEVPATRKRGEELSRTWCAPNFRTSVSRELFHILIPPQREGETNGSDQDPTVQIRLIPDESRAHLRLETRGSLLSLPESTYPGQLRFTAGDSEFHAWKDIQVTGNGVELSPTRAKIRERPILRIPGELRNLFPGFPGSPEVLLTRDLFGNPSPLAHLQITRDLRRAIQRDRQDTLNRAKQYLDQEGERRVGTIRQRIEDRLLDPLQEMGLGPMVRESSTTTERAYFSLGIRTQDQCGGYTHPFPENDPTAVLVIQVHESALNNLVHQVGLDGTTASLLEIQNRVAVRFNSPELLMADPSDGRFIVTFPETDSLRLQCQKDQTIRLTLRITGFFDQYEGTTWNDLEVRAIYRLAMTSEEIRFVRTEPIQLHGPGLGGESQLRLRAIFGRIFGREGYSVIRPGDIFSIESLQSLRFLSSCVRDGWIRIELDTVDTSSGKNATEMTE
ncbi:MAG: hypothetical protein Q4C47_00305 [Planctomycetia bacterium]|nr:hypothetical protein [Planctomycetia bacterium]